MKRPSLTLAVLLALTGFSQSSLGQSTKFQFASDCTKVDHTFHMCDDQNDWVEVYRGGGASSIETTFEDDITAHVEVVQHPRVGVDIKKHNYGSPLPDMPEGAMVIEELTTVDGFAAITYIFSAEIDGQKTMHAQTLLLLHKLRLTAKTAQTGNIYTPEHASRHGEMLSRITHDWSFN